MGNLQSKRTESPGELPPLDSVENIRKRLWLLASANDPVYRAAFGEYVTHDDIHDLLKSNMILPKMSLPHLHIFRGDVYESRYMVVRRLISGRYTSVWLAVDLSTYTTRNNPSCESVAIKISRHELHYSKGIRLEIELRSRILRALESAHIPRTHSGVVRVMSHFYLTGVGSKHICLVMERMRCDARALLNLCASHRLPVETVRLIARDALRALDFLHFHCELVHTDIKPANILVAVDETLLSSGKYVDPPDDDTCELEELRRPPPVVKIGDLGNSSEVTAPRVVTAIGTLNYRAPEVLLGMHYNTNYDVWSLACTIFELLTGAKLFDPKPDPDRSLNESEALLAEIYKIIGKPPQNLRHLPQANLYFYQDGTFRRDLDMETDTWSIQRLLREAHGFGQEEAAGIEDFLRPMLLIDPSQRIQCRDALRHRWLKPVIRDEQPVVTTTAGRLDEALQDFGKGTTESS